MPPVVRALGAFLFHLFKIVKRRTGGSGLFCVRFRLGGNRLFDNRRRHVRRFSRYRLRLINRRRLMGRLRLPLRLCFLRRKRVIFCCGRWRRGVLRRGSDRHRLLPRRTLRLLRLSILRMRLIPLRRRRDNRFAGLRPRYGLPLHGRLRDNRLSPGMGGVCIMGSADAAHVWVTAVAAAAAATGSVTEWPFNSGSYSSYSGCVARLPENRTSSGSAATPRALY